MIDPAADSAPRLLARLAPAAELTEGELERFVLEAVAGRRERPGTNAIERACRELAEVKLDALLWRAWEDGTIEVVVMDGGQLGFGLPEHPDRPRDR